MFTSDSAFRVAPSSKLAALANHYRVIAPDLWGHGESGKLPADARTSADLAGYLSHFLDALGIEKCAVIGSSVGGMWGAELAMKEPSRVRSLVMMATYLGDEPIETRERYFGILDEMEARGAIPSNMLDKIVPLFFRKNAAMDERLPVRLRRVLSGFSTARLRESIVPLGRLIFTRPNALARLSSLDANRTLVMCGADDVIRPPLETQEMAGIIGCRHIFVPNAGHLPNIENPEFVTKALLDWLESQ